MLYIDPILFDIGSSEYLKHETAANLQKIGYDGVVSNSTDRGMYSGGHQISLFKPSEVVSDIKVAYFDPTDGGDYRTIKEDRSLSLEEINSERVQSEPFTNFWNKANNK